MSAQKKRKSLVILAVMMAVVAAYSCHLFFELEHAVDNKMRSFHTSSVFKQIRGEELDLSEVGEMRDLFVLLEARTIDWNSCAIEHEAILDGWGRAVELLIEPEVIRLRSAGADGQFGTSDDIVDRIGEKPTRGDAGIVESN